MKHVVRMRVRRLVLCAVAPLALGFVLEGCSERQEELTGPGGIEVTGTTDSAITRADKERSAVDLGQPIASASTVRTLSVSTSDATVTSIPFAPEPGPFANTVPAYDDAMFDGLPIGFSFTFFGNTYTTFNLSTNGFIGFTPGTSNGCCQGEVIPSTDGGINNLIAAAWTDLNPPGGGGVFYETRGRAPNRYLIVAYENLPWYPEYGTNRVTTQIILYEGTNIIEIHTANQSPGHIYTQGIEDASGIHAEYLPGRVAANYGLTNDGVRWTPRNFWTARAPLPSPRRAFAAGEANGLLYAIGGFNSSGTALSSVVAYNAGTNAWSTKASLPAARRSGNGTATIGSTIYVAGGYDAAGALTRTVFAYNANTNNWRTRASMPVVSSCGGSAAIGRKLYVFSGCTRSSTGQQIGAGLLHRYDPGTNLWTTLRSAPVAHFQPAVGVISGKLYVVGGNNAAGVAFRRLDVYDPATNTWSTRTALPTARVAPIAAVLGARLHVIGGRSGGSYLNTVEAYDPVSGIWETRAAMPTARAAMGAGVISQLLYVFGGSNSTSVLATNERYTP